MIESMVEEIFNDLCYRCEEWIGLEGSDAQLAIFSPAQRGQPKMIFCSMRARLCGDAIFSFRFPRDGSWHLLRILARRPKVVKPSLGSHLPFIAHSHQSVKLVQVEFEVRRFFMNFRRILVPTDLSLNSRMGLRYAFSSAEQCRAEVVILHVASEWPVWQAMSDEMGFVDSNVYRWTVDRIVNEAVLDLNRFLEGHVEEIRRLPKVRKRVVLGKVVDKVVEVALHEEADLIVMAKRRRNVLARILSRSITEAVSRTAPCPVLSLCPPQQQRPWRGRRVPFIEEALVGSGA
jgi:nucleotide-binding universal stress UspA family protein